MSLHIAHILCPTSAPAALKQALYLADYLDAAVHVMPLPSESPLDRDELHARIAPLTSKEPGGPSLHVAEAPASDASPISAVRQYIADENIDLVVTDTPSDRGPVPPLAAASTQALIRDVDCPLFIVEHVEEPASIRRILVPTDFSEPALSALKHAMALARLYDASIDVLYVIDSIPYVALTPRDRLSLGTTPLTEQRGRRRLQTFLQEGHSSDVTIRPHLAYGDPADQIAHFAEQETVDLVLLSSHGVNASSSRPLGTVAESVLGRATRPVFLLSAPGSSLLATASRSSSDSPPP